MDEARLSAGARAVHVRITLAEEDIMSMTRVLPPVLVHAPFYSTTDMLAKIAYTQYQSYLPPRIGKESHEDPWGAAWFTLNGVAVTGRQIPLGILSSYMCPVYQSPLHLVVHFSSTYPGTACPFVAAARSRERMIFNPRHMYFNNLKEALYIRTGKGTQVLELVESEREVLWTAARDGDLSQHLASISRIKTNMCARPGQLSKQIPVRMMICNSPEPGKGLENERLMSRPVPAERADGSLPTLLDTIHCLYPEVLGPQVTCEMHVTSCEAAQHVKVSFVCCLEPSGAPRGNNPTPLDSCVTSTKKRVTADPDARKDPCGTAQRCEGSHGVNNSADRSVTAATIPLKCSSGTDFLPVNPRGPAAPAPCKIVRDRLRQDVHVLVGGLRAHGPYSDTLLATSILDLHRLLHAPDMFLYIVVHMPCRV